MTKQDNNAEELAFYLTMIVRRIYTFYARAWNFREFEILCKKLN